MIIVRILGGLGNQMFQYAYAKMLETKGFKIKLISLPILKPINEKFIQKNCTTNKIISIEENIESGGLGSILTNLFFKLKINKKIHFKSLSLEDKVHNKIGSQSYLRKINKLDKESITKFITKFLNEKY